MKPRLAFAGRSHRAISFVSIIIFFFLLPASVYSQAYIQHSRYLGGNRIDQPANLIVSGGYRYIIGTSNGTGTNTYPITGYGAAPGGDMDIVITKLNPDASIAWSRFLGSSGYDNLRGVTEVNGFLYIAGFTGGGGGDFPVTDGSTDGGSSAAAFLAKINMATGAIAFATYPDMSYLQAMQYDNGSIYLQGWNPSTYTVEIIRYDVVSDAVLYKTSIAHCENAWGAHPEGWYDNKSPMRVVNGVIYLVAATFDPAFYTTDGSTFIDDGRGSVVLIKLKAADGSVQYAGHMGCNLFNPYTYMGQSTINDLQVDNGNAYILGGIGSGDLLTTTDGSRYNDWYSNVAPFIIKRTAANQAGYSKILGDGISNGYNFSMQIESGVLYAGIDNILKLDAATGSQMPAININGASFSSFKIVNGDLYMFGTGSAGYPVTNGTTTADGIAVFMKMSSAGKICYSTFWKGGGGFSIPILAEVDDDSVFVASYFSTNSFPVTDNSSYGGGFADITFTHFVFNPPVTGVSDVTTPSTQNVCQNGIAATISAPEITVSGNSLPVLYENGVQEYQPSIVCNYQWQVADAAGGPWSDISGAVQKDYTPQVQLIDQYYRRLSYTSQCASTPASTSSVAEVLVTGDAAPTVNAGGVFNTCVGTAVTLGGSPTATPGAGATISTYEWTTAGTYSPGNNVANPSVSPSVPTIYTLIVTDNKGCKSAAQALVNVYKADAGADVPTCANQVVRIGTAPIAGVSGITYSWTASPADATMSCTTCAQPDVHPIVATTYTLNVTIPVTGGGTCSTTDQVVVTPVAGPTANFAGTDVTVCNSGSAVLGTAFQSGFTYTWSPGVYLNMTTVAQPTFTPGNISYPNPNPYSYTLTMSKSGCSFTDEVKAYTIGADAGPDVCGPTTIGTEDRMPTLNETYSWTKISGPGNFIGATNTSRVNVGASSGGPTVFRLTVTLNGVSCTDDVTVNDCGCVLPQITVEAPRSCASYSVNGGNVKLVASSSVPVTFSWSPTAGLSTTTGATVMLTDNVNRIYTVTATSTIDPSVSCSNTIEVNHPGWAAPVFNAQEVTVCPNAAVQIGEATVAGYSYAWSGNGLDNNSISNPTATVSSTTRFPVLVTEAVSGCTTPDTAIVNIPGFPGNLAGTDREICGSSIVQLGTDPVAGLTYLWTPAASYDPSDNIANPSILVTTTTTFQVQATNAASGCTAIDNVTVTVKPAATPFTFTDQTFCPSTAGAIALPAGPAGMSEYKWSPANLVQNSSSNGPTATTLSTRPKTATNYTLTVTNASGCKAAATVKLSPSIANPVAGNSRNVCKDNPVQMGASPAMPGTYSWSVAADPASATYTLSSTGISNPVFTPTSAGRFTITVSYTEAGCTTTDEAVITGVEYTIPTMTSPQVCQNSCVQIGVSNPDPSATYAWSPTTGLSNSSIGNPIACVTNSSRGYTLTATGSNGCIATQNIVVGVNPSLSPAVSIPSVNGCYGGGSTTFQPNVTPAGSYQYLWSPDDQTIDEVYSQNPVVYLNTFGTRKYSLTVTDPSNGCSGLAQATLNVNYCVLPVKLESFTATASGKNVLLLWNVAEEVNFDYYAVEYSTNGFDFTVIGTKKGTNSAQYQLLHTNPVHGANYYRLRMVDIDGRIEYSAIRKVNFNATALPEIKLYPNPADNIVHLVLPEIMVNKKATIMIIAIDGRIVMKSQTSSLMQKESINTQSLVKGRYYVRVATAEGIVVNKPLIIVR